MSEHFLNFTIKCPKCGNIKNNSDGFATDDWDGSVRFFRI